MRAVDTADKHLSWREVEVAAARSDLLISNVRLFAPTTGTFSEPTGILVRDGRIHAVGPSHELKSPCSCSRVVRSAAGLACEAATRRSKAFPKRGG